MSVDIHLSIIRGGKCEVKDILVKDIIDVCQGKIACGSKENAIKNVVRDTREVKKGDTYIGFKGEHHDGSLMYEEALQNGASVCILQNESVKDILDIQLLEKNYPNSTIILVDNAIKALQEIAKFKRSLYNIPVVGITGSVGKTSTKDIIASVMAKKYNVHKTQGNYNNQIGVPLTVMGLKDHNAMVIEMGMNQKGEIQPIGGVNDKIEGFFQICKLRGLDGSHGVMIPVQNIKNLNLSDEIIEAVKQKLFHVYAITTIEEGIEVLTGVPAGKKDKDGHFPAGTINYLVYEKLKKYAEISKEN